MKSFRDILWVLYLVQIQARAVQTCGAAEELSIQDMGCVRPAQDNFTTFGPRIEIDGAFRDVGSCDSDGNCNSVDKSRFILYSTVKNDKRNVSLVVTKTYRNMTRFMCFTDGIPVPDAVCDTDVYVKGKTPVCEEPKFIDGGSNVVVTCVSESIYPSGNCKFGVKSEDFGGNVNSYVTSDNTPIGGNGDQRLECRLNVKVTGSEPGTYRFLPAVIPNVANVPDKAQVSAKDTISLDLYPTALYNRHETRHVFDYPSTGELDIQIAVTGNPRPSRTSLSTAYEDGASFSPLPGNAYQATYAPSLDSSTSGIITLVVKGGLDSTKQTFYTLRADNGVLGSDEFEYSFRVNKADDEPEPDDEGGTGDHFLLIVGVLVGGVCLLIFITLMVLVCRRNFCGRETNRHGRYNDAPFDPPSFPGCIDMDSGGYIQPIDTDDQTTSYTQIINPC